MFNNILGVVFRDFLVAAINYGISSLLALMLDKEVVGIWFALQTLFLVGDSFLRYRSDVVMVLRYKSGENIGAIGAQFIIAGVTTLFVLLIALLLSHLLFTHLQNLIPISNPWTVKIVLISLSLSILITTYLYFLTAQKAFNAYNLVLISQALVNFAVVGGTIIFGMTTVMSPVLGQFAAWLIVLPFALRAMLSYRRHSSWDEITSLTREGAHFYLNSFMSVLQLQIPRVYAMLYLSIQDVAELGLLFVLVSLMLKYPAAIKTVLFAESHSGLRWKPSHRSVITKLGYVTVLFYCLAFISAPIVISISFGSLYSELGQTFQSLLFFVLLHSLAVVILGIRNMAGDYRSMNASIFFSAFGQLICLTFEEPSLDLAILSYKLFTVLFFCLSLIFTLSAANKT